MIDPQLLDILVCPETKEPVQLAGAELLARINRAIAAGKLVNRAGEKVGEPLDGGLVRQDGKLLYPIREDIPIMLVEEAIPLPLAD
ncbi:MAG TPA: Trm112 family protein [bacterium]|nr:Trm112 family protein [bacterium]